MYPQDLPLTSSWMNAAGTLGFAPPARWPLAEAWGAFVTNPISLSPRSPAAERAALAYPGGVLLHSGLPNPGLRYVLRRYTERWKQSLLPIWVHLIGAQPTEISEMVRQLEGSEGVQAVELGLPPDLPGGEVSDWIRAAVGELPVIVHLPLTDVAEAWVQRLPELGVSAMSLGAPRGVLFAEPGKPIAGRMLGPSLLPLTLAAVRRLRSLGLPIIAGPGVYHRVDAQALQDAGASAVQLDSVLWRGWMDV